MLRLPTFLIIGSPKAGTTALYNYLRQHPDVFMSPIKEPRFFAYEGGRPPFYDPRNLDWSEDIYDFETYQRLFDGAENHAAVGEATPGYLYWPPTAERIFQRIPDARLIVMLRHPAERAFSQFMHHRRDNWEPIADFNDALDAEPERIRANWDPAYFYATRSIYVPQLQRYLNLFRPEQIGIFLLEDFKNDPHRVLAGIFSHIGVDPNFQADLSVRFNQSGMPQSRFLFNFVNRAAAGIRQTAEMLPVTRRLMKSSFTANLGSSIRSAMLSKQEIPPAARARMIEYCREDVLTLQDILHRDLSIYLR